MADERHGTVPGAAPAHAISRRAVIVRTAGALTAAAVPGAAGGTAQTNAPNGRPIPSPTREGATDIRGVRTFEAPIRPRAGESLDTRAAQIESRARNALEIAGDGIRVSGGAWSTTGRLPFVHGAAVMRPSADVVLDGLTIDTTRAQGGGRHAFHSDGGAIRDFRLSGLRLKSAGYGVLTNERGPADGMIVTNFFIDAVADAIEYNSPKAGQQHTVTWGGIVSAGLGGTGTNAGFALGHAHNRGFVSGGLVSRAARREAVHVEDGCSFGVLSSMALLQCQSNGIWGMIGGFGGNQAEATPIPITAFTLEGPGAANPDASGVYLAWDRAGATSRWPVATGYVKGFATGLFLDGPGVHPATEVTVDNADAVLRLGGRGRHFGTLFSNTSAALLSTDGGGARAGRFVQSDAAPKHIVRSMGGGTPAGSRVDAFAFPVTGRVRAGGSTALPLFQAPRRLHGRLILDLHAPAGAVLFWHAGVRCADGRSVGTFDTMEDVAGDFRLGSVGVAAFRGTIRDNILRVAGIEHGAVAPGQMLSGGLPGTRIVRQIDGRQGGVGSYLVDAVQQVEERTFRSASPLTIHDGMLWVDIASTHARDMDVTVMLEFDGTYYA